MTPPAATVPAAPPAPRFDFPTWLPAMLVKELRQGLRARSFVGSFMGFQTVMIIAFFYAAILPGGAAFDAANSMFWALLIGVLLGVTPLRALAGLGSELEGRAVDLLVLTRLDAARIVLGKWVSLNAQAALLAAALLPYGVLRYYLGSVDLLADLGQVAELLGGCALLTAVALWISGWPKSWRILGAVGLVPAYYVLVDQSAMSSYGGSPVSLFRSILPSFGHLGLIARLGPGWESAVIVAVLAYDGLLLISFSLVQAARRLAPPAENHSSSTRVLALLTLVPPPLLAWLVGAEFGVLHLLVSAVALFLICGMELSRVAAPMRVQVRPWLNAHGRWRTPGMEIDLIAGGVWPWLISHARWRRLAGPLMLPGWPSAALFAIFALALLLGITLLVGLALLLGPGPSSWVSPSLLVWWVTLGWVALVCPILLLTFLGHHARFSMVGYWIVQGLMATLGIISLGGTPGPHARTYLIVFDAVSQMLPISSFWLGWAWVKPDAAWTSLTYTPLIMLGQFAVLTATILLYQLQSRSYWLTVREYAARPAPDPAEPSA